MLRSVVLAGWTRVAVFMLLGSSIAITSGMIDSPRKPIRTEGQSFWRHFSCKGHCDEEVAVKAKFCHQEVYQV